MLQRYQIQILLQINSCLPHLIPLGATPSSSRLQVRVWLVEVVVFRGRQTCSTVQYSTVQYSTVHRETDRGELGEFGQVVEDGVEGHRA